MIDYLPISQGNALAFRIRGTVSLEQEQHWISELQKVIDEEGKLRMMVILEEDAQWGIKAGIEDLKFALKHSKEFEKIAIVSNSQVMKWLVSIDDFFASFLNISEQHFLPEQQAEAWQWVQQ
ncbi:STAS/SEC14 domain-containing protein [Bacterioplanoides sp. SCSIO 12839]|uniref:STAS/SEC14 domain-containing protein n=1 Tax=Bacterioplanoides sp. SCSIO 12839 TaxID=2829569 RepID=UPI002106E60A|nr:STAS/SEC14 domain-containing protein [Bacterioplanoides sp. SCSIO 12839]UTW46911.1 STAS/SEC14 domain-containing protein [Bacterioplanoides sp. SCSIO 12839]